MVELYLHYRIRLHGLVLNSLSSWLTLSLLLLPILQWELLLPHSHANYDVTLSQCFTHRLFVQILIPLDLL
jgi:hypothetical protein